MRVKPILFDTDGAKRILEGRQTATRRVIKPQPEPDLRYRLGFCTDGCREDIGKFGFGLHECGGRIHFVRPPCLAGDILYVRETWDDLPVDPEGSYCGYDKYYYKADGDIRPEGWKGKWHPSIYMLRSATRIWLKVTEVKVERLQDITQEQMLEEGADKENIKRSIEQLPEIPGRTDAAYKLEYSQLWDSTIKRPVIKYYGWYANPWVWVILFERCEMPEDLAGKKEG